MKAKFLKLWNLLGYFERTTSGRTTCQRLAFWGANCLEWWLHAILLNLSRFIMLWTMLCPYLPTLPVFRGVSKFFIKSPDLPGRAPNLPDKMDFWAFLCFSLKFSPFFHKLRTFLIHCTVSGTFLHMFSQWQRLVRHYNDESAFWSHVRHVRRHIMS